MPVKKVTSDKKQVTSQKSNVTLEGVKRPIGSKKSQAQDRGLTSKEVRPLKSAAGANVLSVPVYSLLGKEAGTLDLPKEIFGQKVNKALLAQAVRVYSTNQKVMSASTKTRGEVKLTKAKWFRQKGTGRARHGAQSAPIFVGGGVAFGPKPRKVELELPKKMKKAALISALSNKAQESTIAGLSGLEKASGKTKEMVNFREKWLGKGEKSKSTLIVTGEKLDNVVRGVKNIPGFDVLPASQLNAYEVLGYQNLLLTKEAVEKLGSRIRGQESGGKEEK